MEKIVIYLLVGYCFYYIAQLIYKSISGKGKSSCSGCTDCSGDTPKK